MLPLFRRLHCRLINCFAVLLLALTLSFSSSHARADFVSGYSVQNSDTLWLGGTITCGNLSKTSKTTVTFGSSTFTYTLNGKVCTATVPGGSIVFDPKCKSPSTSYGSGWNTTAPCSSTNQFMCGCVVQLPSNCKGSITNVNWSNASCSSNTPKVSCSWQGSANDYPHCSISYSSCSVNHDGSVNCGQSCRWSCSCSGGSGCQGGGGSGTPSAS